MDANPVTVLIVPGLRDAVPQHWQTLLGQRLRAQGRPVAEVPPMGRTPLDCAARVAAIERAAHAVTGPLVIVAHSGGCIAVAHWASTTNRPVQAALLAVPPDFETPMPDGHLNPASGFGDWPAADALIARLSAAH